MKFSISTSFYKRVDKVQHLYNQILNQTYTNWEWIVTDDFSEEGNAEELLKEICTKDPRVKYYQQSRKKECFYNPQRGASGDIIIMLDSDDYAFPKTLELYYHFFLKHPEVSGMSCLSYTIDGRGIFAEIQGGGTYKCEDYPTFNFTPMNRAFKNVFKEFDNGVLEFYQNDTNIVRHIETIGKWLYLPRVLCEYYYSPDTISRAERSPEEWQRVEQERIFIESKFPYLQDPDKCSSLLYYIPVRDLARAFSICNFNKDLDHKNILFVKKETTPAQRMLLKELFYEQNLYFDYNKEFRFDEVVIHLDEDTYNSLEEIIEILRVYNSKVPLRLFLDERLNSNSFDTIDNKIAEMFGCRGWAHGGYETYFSTAV
jgi:glycosyltransferase involved in cell wall biosynthesis